MSYSRWRKVAVGCLAAVVFSSTGLPGHAAPVNKLGTKPFVYQARNVAVVDLLRDFAGAQSLPLVIADGVTGIVNSNFNLAPESFLNTVSRAFGLIWYFDGMVLYIYPSSQMQTRVFKVKGKKLQSIEATLQSFGLGDRRFPVQIQANLGLGMVVGPPRHIELVEAMLSALAAVDIDGPVQVRAFKLKYASAVDRSVQGVRVRGVASTLTAIYAEKANGAGGGGANAPTALGAASEQLLSLEGTPEQRAARDASFSSVARSAASGGAKSVTPNMPMKTSIFSDPGADVRTPSGHLVFTAEEGTNTVIARVPGDQMATIESLITRLDVPNDMVEIEATIIDISSDDVQALGFDWTHQGYGGSVQTSLQISPAVATGGVSNEIPQGGGYNITTLLQGKAGQLISRIRALEARGAARIVSQPRVLGAVNRMASLSDKRTASVRVAGRDDAKLFSVDAGTTLEVTPRLILGSSPVRIGMDLFIEDGGFSASSVDDVPIVQRTTIRTDVTLNEGQTLVVGGISTETSGSGESGVPGLSKIPFIGRLFRVNESHSNKRQRMFMLTPKRVSLFATETPFSGTQPAPPTPVEAPAISREKIEQPSSGSFDYGLSSGH